MSELIDREATVKQICKMGEMVGGHDRDVAISIALFVQDDKSAFPTAEERPHGEWIPCSERLPEECENALAWIERDAWIDGSDYPKRKQEVAIGWHIDGRWHFDGYAGSTTECLAWMPLPEPYEEEGEKNEQIGRENQ